MWVCMSDSFVSIVRHEGGFNNHLLVRTRDRESLVAFLNHINNPTLLPEITETPDSDYRFRAVVPDKIVAAVLADYTSHIDYPNFKNSVQDIRRKCLYSVIWNAAANFYGAYGDTPLPVDERL